jgi:inorganic pyrophosphatase
MDSLPNMSLSKSVANCSIGFSSCPTHNLGHQFDEGLGVFVLLDTQNLNFNEEEAPLPGKMRKGNVPAVVIWRPTVDLARIPAQPKPGIINVLIEIPAGSKNKYEFDKDLNAFALDRVLFSSVQYPLDYGFVPNTLADDGDPLDGMVIMDQPTFPGCVIAARPIGMLEMIDGGDRDEKILCVPDKDPRYAQVKSIKDISQHRLDEITEFFKTYKNLEKKVTEILGWQDADKVAALVAQCVAAHK